MINNSNIIIGAAVYDTILNLSKDSAYIDKIVDYQYQLGLSEYKVKEGENDAVKLAVFNNPQIALFYYSGDDMELSGLYSTSNSLDGKPSYSNRYIGVWNLVPRVIKKIDGFKVFDVDVVFLAPILEEWSTEARENIVFPLFDKIKDTFLKNLESYPYVKNKAPYGLDYEEDRGYNYDGVGKNEIGDEFSYLRLSFKLQIATNECEKEFRVLNNKYLTLKDINSYE